MVKFIQVFSVLLFSLLCYSCSTMTDDEGVFRDRRHDYRKVEEQSRMVVPEGLDQQTIVDIYPVPALSPYASKEMIKKPPMPTRLQGETEQAIKIQKVGGNIWVYTPSSPSQLWPRLKQFISQEQLVITVEHGGVGIIETKNAQGVYRFKVEQGFQRNTAELLVRHVREADKSQVFWPALSDDAELEQQMLKKAAQFFADQSDQPAYSYAAQGISIKKKLLSQPLENGGYALVLLVDQKRAVASLKNALESAEFVISNYSPESNSFSVRYLPQLPESKQPGFWGKLFGRKHKDFDKDVAYAGRFYQIGLRGVSDGQQLTVQLDKAADPKQEQQAQYGELEQIVSLIRGSLR